MYGHIGGEFERNGIFCSSYGSISDRGLRNPGSLDFYGFCCLPFSYGVVSVLPRILGNYRFGAFSMPAPGAKKISENRCSLICKNRQKIYDILP